MKIFGYNIKMTFNKIKEPKVPFKYYMRFGNLVIEQMSNPKCFVLKNNKWVIIKSKKQSSGDKK